MEILLKVLITGFLFSSCNSTRILDNLCQEWEYLKYPTIRKGYVGKDVEAQGEICFQRKWKSYVGLSEECIIELLGEPIEKKKNEFIYYFGNAKREMVVGKLHLYFTRGKMKRIHCSLV